MRPVPYALCLLPLGLAVAVTAAGASAPARPATDVCGPVAVDAHWAAAGSPYVTTCDVTVPAGATLTIEAGTTVQLGSYHRLVVSGALRAIGTASAPIHFEASDVNQPWGSVQLDATSGPSELAYVVFAGGGSGHREMLGIAASQALVRNARFGKTQGIAVEIKGGASPTIRDSAFVEATDDTANPPAALRIRGASDAVITGNFFQSNTYAVFWEANASPRFEANRFAMNGEDGVLVYGTITRAVRLPSLGPRAWHYVILSPSLIVDTGGTLTIEPGATLRFSGGTGISVKGTLVIRGAATNEVLLSSSALQPQPGQWNEIDFQPSSVDYAPGTGEGCIIDHAIIEYGGSKQTGTIYVRNSSPRISNTLIRHSGQRAITVLGEESHPDLIGNLFDANTDDPEGVGVFATGGSAPQVSFSIFRNNWVGVRSERAATPRIGKHNWFDRNSTYGVSNDDREVCVEATANDWGAAAGPNDASAAEDACGEGSNDSPDGDMVSNHVRYRPFEGQLPRPQVTSPRCGTTGLAQPTIAGLAPPNSQVQVYDNQVLLGTAQAGPDAVSGGLANFSFNPPALTPGSHVLQLLALLGTQSSGISNPLELLFDPNQVVDPAGTSVSYDLDGTHFVQPFQSPSGCLTMAGGEWQIRIHPVSSATLNIPIACPGGVAPQAVLRYGDAAQALAAAGGGVYRGSFDPAQGGTLGLRVTCGAQTTEMLLGSVNIEYNGIVYDGKKGPALGRINGAAVTLYEWDTATLTWRVWPAQSYFGQTNPLVTGAGGWLAFYPPPGYYHATASAKGYVSATSKDITITTEPFVENFALEAEPGGIYLPVAMRQFQGTP